MYNQIDCCNKKLKPPNKSKTTNKTANRAFCPLFAGQAAVT